MKTILLIEKNIAILENLTEGFEMEGYKVLAANSAILGVQYARAFLPDVIICDVVTDNLSGGSFLNLLLDSGKKSEIPCIFSSSIPTKNEREKLLKSGADHYIIKPFGLESAFNIVNLLINSGRKSYDSFKINNSEFYRIKNNPNEKSNSIPFNSLCQF